MTESREFKVARMQQQTPGEVPASGNFEGRPALADESAGYPDVLERLVVRLCGGLGDSGVHQVDATAENPRVTSDGAVAHRRLLVEGMVQRTFCRTGGEPTELLIECCTDFVARGGDHALFEVRFMDLFRAGRKIEHARFARRSHEIEGFGGDE